MNDLPTKILAYTSIAVGLIGFITFMVVYTMSKDKLYDLSHNPKNPFRKYDFWRDENNVPHVRDRETDIEATSYPWYRDDVAAWDAKTKC